MKYYERITDTHLYFLTGPFSNFAYSPFILDGIKWENTEAAFMYYKAIHFKDFKSAEQIKKETNPVKAKGLGRAVSNFNDAEWEKARYAYMYKVNLAKYTQNSLFFETLMNTKELVLVETNGNDRVWGIGLYASDDRVLDEDKWKGRNLLGNVLMDIRKYFFNLKV